MCISGAGYLTQGFNLKTLIPTILLFHIPIQREIIQFMSVQSTFGEGDTRANLRRMHSLPPWAFGYLGRHTNRRPHLTGCNFSRGKGYLS